MATTDNDTLHRFYDQITVGSKRFSGIVGDARHAASGGYHIGRNFVPRLDYSAGQGGLNSSSRDRGGDGDVSCAIDVSFSTSDMILVTQRLINAMSSGALSGVREFNGTLNGSSTVNRDQVLGWRQNYVPDDTHLWHIHIGFFRDTAQDWNTLSRVVAVINGGSASPVQEDDMFSDSDRAALARIDQAVSGIDAKANMLRTAAFQSARTSEVLMGVRPPAPTDPAEMQEAKPSVKKPWKYKLSVDDIMTPGDTLWSPNGLNKLIFQADGNVVLYGGSFGDALWSTGTWGKPATQFHLQSDGNLVEYSDAGALWTTNTNNGYELYLQDDSNLVLYSKAGTPVWYSNTRG